jgi:archaellum component FlaF (FlaF/FlaG flagellin family)
MGLSIAISGAIVLSTLVFLFMSMPGILVSIFSIEETSSLVSDLEESISNTNTSIDSLAAVSGSAKVNFTLNNDGNQKLWDFDNFDVIVFYDGASSKVTDLLTYDGSCLGSVPQAGNWCIEEIEWDLADPGVLNRGEGAMIRTQLNQNPVTGIIVIDVTVNNGVSTSLSATT